MNRIAHFLVMPMVALSALGGSVLAGGMKGSMFDLPKAGGRPITDKEFIGITVTDTEGLPVTLLDEKGNRFAADRYRGDNKVVFAGPSYAFTLSATDRTDGRRFVNIVFSRQNNPFEKEFPTQFLQNIVMNNDPKQILALDVVVPRPQDMDQDCPYYMNCYETCHRGLFGLRGRFRR